MDYFSLCLDGLCLLGQGVIHIAFVSRLTGKKEKIWHFAIYLFLLCIIQWFFTTFDFSDVLPIGAELLVLYSVSRLALRNRQAVSWTAAILAVYITQLSFGIVNSVEIILFPHMLGKTLLYLLVLLATLTVFVICACCCGAVLKFLSLTEDQQMPYVGLLLFPGLFFFAAELYILQTSYSVLPVSISLGEAGKHGVLFLVQILGLVALLCTLYAYQHICRSFQTQAALRSLEQAARAQKNYIAGAQRRYEQTKAFRHDIKNHLSVLGGLLKQGKLDEGRAYLEKLETVTAALSFPYQTGNPVVDILLGEKLELAKAYGIKAEVELLLPNPCLVDDYDFCVIFANALDNAINACRLWAGEKAIRVFGKIQGDFLMLEFENTCQETDSLPPMGTGLSNIKMAAEKYSGTIITEKSEERFCLNVLLNISLHSDGISCPKP